MENRDRELLMRFIQQESEIKERWQIVEFFEEEKQRFERERKTLLAECEKLDKEYAEKSSLVESLRDQIEALEQSHREIERKEQESRQLFKEREERSLKLNEESKNLSKQLATQKEEFKSLSFKIDSLKVEYIVRQNAIKVIKEKRDAMLESTALSSVHEVSPLKQVEVMGKGGKVIKAIPAKNYYAHSVVSIQSDEDRSQKELVEEIQKLRAKNIDLEIERGNMNLEMRELKNELQTLNHLLAQKKVTPIKESDDAPKAHPSNPSHAIEQKEEGSDESTQLLEEEPLNPQEFTSSQLDEEEILEVKETSANEASEASGLESHTPPCTQEAEGADSTLPSAHDLPQALAVQEEDKSHAEQKALKSNPFMNNNVRIITPQGFKTLREVMQS